MPCPPLPSSRLFLDLDPCSRVLGGLLKRRGGGCRVSLHFNGVHGFFPLQQSLYFSGSTLILLTFITSFPRQVSPGCVLQLGRIPTSLHHVVPLMRLPNSAKLGFAREFKVSYPRTHPEGRSWGGRGRPSKKKKVELV